MIGPWRRARNAERALEVAETDRDIARAQARTVRRERAVMVAEVIEERDATRADLAAVTAERESAYDAIGKIAAAAGRPGAPTRWNVEDLVDWALAALSWRTRHTQMVQQAETFEAELLAVDEALARAGATIETVPGGRTAAINWLAAGRPPLDGQRSDAAWRAEHWDTHSPELAAARVDDDVVDVTLACGRGCTVDVDCGDDDGHDGPCWPSPYSLARRALDVAARNRPDLAEHMRAVWTALVSTGAGSAAS